MHQDDFANPLGVFCQEDLKSMQLLRNTLDVVQTIDTNDQLDALELLLERLNAFRNLGLLEALLELLGIDTDRESTNSDNLALELNCVGRCRKLTTNC